MTSPRPGRVPRAMASVTRSVRGVPWWAAVVLAFVPTFIGRLLGGPLHKGPTVLLWVGLVAGTLLAALLVRRRAVFTAMVQMPIVCAAALVMANLGGGGLKSMVYSAGLEVVRSFPAMAIATALALCIGTLRIAAQPLRSAPTASSTSVTAAPA